MEFKEFNKTIIPFALVGYETGYSQLGASRFVGYLPSQATRAHGINYRLTHSASELSGFTCTSSLTMNEKFQYRTRPPSAVLKNFEFIVSERVQVNPDNSRAMSALTFLLFKLNTPQAKIVKF